MPYHKRQYSPGKLQFITASTYRRAPLFLSERFCRCFVETLAEARQATQFLLIGWVLMPDHFHLLIKPEPAETTTLIVQRLKSRTATRVLKLLRDNQEHPWCQKMLARLVLPPSVHDESHYRAWQRRFYPFSIHSEKKRLEKLDYMHNNPVKRGLASSPGEWAWSSWRGRAGVSISCRMRLCSRWIGWSERDKDLSLREIADTTMQASAPAGDTGKFFNALF